MAKVLVTDQYLTDIADAIRAKKSVATTYKPSEMAGAVESIETGITPTGTKNITTNGTHDVTNFASAEVAVPNSFSASDEGKVVSNGALVAQTAQTVTENGTYDTTLKNSVVVNVSGGGGTSKWFPIVEKHAEDMKRGYVSSGSFMYAPEENVYCDVWRVTAQKAYIIALGGTVGNRFRAMFSTADTSTATSNVSGNNIGSDLDSPSPYSVKIKYSGQTAFIAPSDGYITVGKTNAGEQGVPCYLVDITNVPNQ